MNDHDESPTRDTDFAARASDSYARLRELFAVVAELGASERAAWIEAHVTDAQERAALQNLLSADCEDGYFDIPPDEHAARMSAEEPLRAEGLVGQRIGAFRLCSLIGKGGMAVVFLGEREGGDFAQRAAVKLLRRGLYSEIEQRLFRRERQLLAGLDHPNIARLIDGGVTAAGIPYLVIEYVAGEAITSHAARHALDVRERLALFLVVCRAVAAAHRALIVHRDIKPSNILVTADGTVKLLDFGIAKLLEDDTDNATVGVFTPEYAAPEQLANAPVTTATDVYALGVLLHELLLGIRPPRRPPRRPSQLVDEAARHLSVPRPDQLARALRGDLDTIVLRCLAEEADQRYASAGALADDVARHLAGRPVEAHPPSRWYRARKFVLRHRGSVAITAALVIAVLAGLTVAVWQARVARHEAARAREIQGFVESLFQPLEEARTLDRTPSVGELLERGLARVDTAFHDDRRAQAELLSMFVRINDTIGEVKRNLDLSQRAWRLSATVYGDGDLRTFQAHERYARVLENLGRDTEALAEYTAIRVAMERAGIRGVAHAHVLDDIERVRANTGVDNTQTITTRRGILAELEQDPAASADDLSNGYNSLGNAYDTAEQWDQALYWYRKSYETDLRSRGESLVSAIELGNIGSILFWSGRWREAASTLEAARASYARAGIEKHVNLMSHMVRLCDVQGALEDIDKARVTCDAAVEMARTVVGEHHRSFVYALLRRAGAEVRGGDLDAARADFARARAAAATPGTALGRDAGKLIDVAQSTLDWTEGDFAALREHLKDEVNDADSRTAPSAPRSYAWFALACARARGDGCAPEQARMAQGLVEDPRFAHQPNQLPGRVALAELALLDGDPARAADEIAKGLAAAAAELGAHHTWVGEAHLVLGKARAAAGDTAAAKAEFSVAADILGKLPADHPLRLRAERLATGAPH